MSLSFKSSKVEVAAASMAELVEFVNAHSGKPPIKKFESRAKGVERVTAMIVAADPSMAGATRKEIAAMAKPEPPKAPATKPTVRETMASAKIPLPSAKPKAPTSAAEAMARTLVAQSAGSPAPAKKAAPVAGSGRASFGVDDVITVVHKGENPKRGTAAERYDLYKSGMTVAAYIAAGGQRRDVVWDQKMGWITVKAAK